MLLLLIITLTNAPNNASVCTVSQQEALGAGGNSFGKNENIDTTEYEAAAS